MQLVEHGRDLGRFDLLRQHADRAEGARLPEIELTFLRGVHHDRDGRGARIVLDRLHGLETVHARHQVIHEDHVGARAREVVDRLFGGFGAVDLELVLFEDAREKGARRAGVVDDQCTLAVYARQLGHPDAGKVGAKCNAIHRRAEPARSSSRGTRGRTGVPLDSR
jgi:hypothetical protein